MGKSLKSCGEGELHVRRQIGRPMWVREKIGEWHGSASLGVESIDFCAGHCAWLVELIEDRRLVDTS